MLGITRHRTGARRAYKYKIVNLYMITLTDFPNDIYVLLEDNYRAKFFKTAWVLSGGYRKLAKTFGVSNVSMLGWRCAKQGNSKIIRFCPVWALKKISKLLVGNGHKEFELNEIQKYIIGYKARHGIIINNPKIPIMDSTDLRAFVTHVFCDGTAQNIAQRTCKYDSTSYGAVEGFRDLLKVFGSINRKITFHKRLFPAKDAYRVSFPKAIAKILINKFGSFDSDKARIPKEFFRGDRKLLSAIVRAFLIDEGSIRDTRITFTSKNILLLKDLIEICKKLDYKCCKIRKTWTAYEFTIGSESLKQVYTDLMKISPLSIDYKQKRLEFGVKILDYKKNFSNIKGEILEALEENPLTNVELSHKIACRARAAWGYLKELERDGLIKGEKVAGRHGAYIYELA